MRGAKDKDRGLTPRRLTLFRGYRFRVEDMDVTLMYFDDCPNWKVADERLHELADEIDGMTIHHRYVGTAEDAEKYQFRGSPSILVDGVDPFAEADDPVGLSCRVYQTPDGMAGSPTLEQLRSALTS